MLRLRQLTLPEILVLLATQSACGSSGSNGLPGEVGTYDDAGPSFAGGDAGGGGALDAHVERSHIAVTFVTLSCAGPCADVQAVGTGGNPPYTFEWEDGSTSASRHVCPTTSTSYQVTVTDTGTSGELARPAETAQASLTADVIACPDGETSDGGLCVSNPSFEGTPGVNAFNNFNVPPWATCLINGADVVDPSVGSAISVSFPAPTDGATYVNMVANRGDGDESVSEALCAPMHAGVTYALRLDLASIPEGSYGGDAPASLEIWGGTSSCGRAQLLWSSAVGGASWRTDCATLTPSQETPYLTLTPRTTSGQTGALLVDHLVPVASCP